MTQQHFGTRLAEARKRRGLSFEQVHNQLRITPAILESLERADFYHMPLKGHARNMVSSYARFLGLDPNEMTKQFLKEYHEFENHVAHRDSAQSSYLGYRSGAGSSGGIENRPSALQRSSRAESSQGINSMWNKRIPRSELNRGHSPEAPYDGHRFLGQDDQEINMRRGAVAHEQTAKMLSGRKAQPQIHGSHARNVSTALFPRQRVPSAGDRYEASRAEGRSEIGRAGSSYSVGGYSAKPSLPLKLFGTFFNKPIALIIALIVLLVLIFAIWAIMSNSCKSTNEVSQTPKLVGSVVTGEAGTENSDGGSNNRESAANTGSFELIVAPVGTEAPYTIVEVDGAVVWPESALTGEQKWTVVKSCKVSTTQPENITVKKNGEIIGITPNEGSVYHYVVIEATPSS